MGEGARVIFGKTRGIFQHSGTGQQPQHGTAEPGEAFERLRGGRQGHMDIRQRSPVDLLPAGEAAEPAQVSQLDGQQLFSRGIAGAAQVTVVNCPLFSYSHGGGCASNFWQDKGDISTWWNWPTALRWDG